MKFYSVLFSCFLIICAPVLAANQYFHPQTDHNDKSKSALTWPSYCEIELVNNSYETVNVQGIFDDGSSIVPFTMYRYDSPHYISLYYYGYCHAGMNIYVDTWSGYRIFAGYVRTHSTIYVIPYLAGKVKAEMHHK